MSLLFLFDKRGGVILAGPNFWACRPSVDAKSIYMKFFLIWNHFFREIRYKTAIFLDFAYLYKKILHLKPLFLKKVVLFCQFFSIDTRRHIKTSKNTYQSQLLLPILLSSALIISIYLFAPVSIKICTCSYT